MFRRRKLGQARICCSLIFYFYRDLFCLERPYAHTAAVIQSHFFVFMVGASAGVLVERTPEAWSKGFLVPTHDLRAPIERVYAHCDWSQDWLSPRLASKVDIYMSNLLLHDPSLIVSNRVVLLY